MRLYQLPHGWEDFSATLLQAKLDEINALANKVTETTLDIPADEEAGTVSGLEYAESLRDAKVAVQAKLSQVTEDEQAKNERRNSVLADLAAAEDPEEEDADEGDEEGDTDEGDEPAAAAAIPAPAPEPAATPEPAAATPEPAAAVAEPPANDTDTQPVETETEERELVAASNSQRNAADALRAMNARRAPAETPRATDNTPSTGRMRATGEMTADGWRPGDFMEDLDGLSEYVSARLRAMSGNWDGPSTKIPLVTSMVEFDDDTTLHASDIEHNYGVFARNERGYVDAQLEALTAAGAPCAPIMPSYEFETCYTVQRPVETGLPVVGAPRGGIRYLDQVPLDAESAAAITLKDAAANALLPEDIGYVAKACTRVSCPTETQVTVAAISWCVTFDNLGYRVFPEQVRNMLQRVAIEYAKRKEVFYLDRIDQLAGAAVDIDAALTGAGAANPYGTGRSIFSDLVTAGHNYRKRNNMSRDAILDVWLPDVVEDNLAVDMVNDPNMSAVGTIMTGPNGNLTQVVAQRARFNINWYYYDSDEVGFPASAHDGAAAAWNPLPTVFRSYIHAPGAIQRLDAGQLDLGVVRDSTLNADNDLQLFAEQWIEVAKPGCEVVAYDHTTCYSGVGPLHVAAPACP